MGLSNSTSAKYVGTYGGKFTMKAMPDTPNARKRVNRNNAEVWELTYDRMEGIVTNIKFTEREHDGQTYRNLNLSIEDGPDNYTLSVGQTSNLAGVFFQTMEAIDFSKVVEFSIWKDNDNKVAVVIRQGGDALKWKYTKANPGNKPAWKKVELNGEVHYDRTDELKFYRDIVETSILPKIKDVDPNAITADGPPDFPTAAATVGTSEGEDSDLPF